MAGKSYHIMTDYKTGTENDIYNSVTPKQFSESREIGIGLHENV